jgi:hypothetical protein
MLHFIKHCLVSLIAGEMMGLLVSMFSLPAGYFGSI